jgi:hypothetical protein
MVNERLSHRVYAALAIVNTSLTMFAKSAEPGGNARSN